LLDFFPLHFFIFVIVSFLSCVIARSEATKQSHLLSVISGITSSFGTSQEQMGLLRPPSAGSQ